ncbi:MAG TPA: MCP four helix bundle domain-containing protein, partial [Burkholderiales bacterium]|nr:MCP four helix bundle domain-containing protein [Burkholderiales bacterium]
MGSLGKLKIGVKLGIAFGAVLVLSAAASGMSLNRIFAMNEQWQEFQGMTLAKRVTVSSASEALGDAVQNFKNYILHGGEYAKQFHEKMQDVSNALAAYRELGAPSEQEEVLLRAATSAIDVYRQGAEKVAELSGKKMSLQELDSQVDGVDRPIAVILSNLIEITNDRTRNASEEMDRLLRQAKQVVISMMIVLLVVGIAFAVAITRGITVPLGKALRVARRVSSGDLTSEI